MFYSHRNRNARTPARTNSAQTKMCEGENEGENNAVHSNCCVCYTNYTQAAKVRIWYVKWSGLEL